MLRLLADVNFHGDIVRGLRLRRPAMDLVRAQDVGLDGFEDPEVLEWAALNDRIVLTHDRTTMPPFAYDRVAAGESMPGVTVVSDQITIGRAIDDILLMDECSEPEEWKDRVVFIPL